MKLPRRRLVALAAVAAVPRAFATPAEVDGLIRTLVGESPLKDGLVHLDLPVLVENGNAVAMRVSVTDPPSPVESIHVFAEGNPLPVVAVFRFGPRSGVPAVSTRIRLATSQTVIAIARLRDGTCWRDSAEPLVTLAACIE
ncbi:MAG: sulfur oxidation protein SoxY [Acetobacteraceae bacterium]|nr:sulfur oxidation protein SoxY [Acetobacteraceae bacterium]